MTDIKIPRTMWNNRDLSLEKVDIIIDDKIVNIP